MQHNYTEEEIKAAENEAFRRKPLAKGHEWVKAFLDALPERPQAAEIAKLKAALAESEKQFQAKVDEIARLLDERDRRRAELAALRQPILADEPAQAQQAEAQPWTPAVGDIVRLKSGGPVMTVSRFNDENEAVCEWFSGDLTHVWNFPAACLTPAQP